MLNLNDISETLAKGCVHATPNTCRMCGVDILNYIHKLKKAHPIIVEFRPPVNHSDK